MKARPFHFGLILGLIVLGGCAGKPGKTVPDQAPLGPEFRPKKVYALEMKQAWDVTLKALKQEGIPLAIANKDIWVIQTDYQNLSFWERNKCDIRFSQEPQRNTYIFVHCQYEGRNNVTEPFRDFTYSAPRKAMKAEEEIYRKLEPHILSFERAFPAQEEVSAKPGVPYAPAQISGKAAPKAEAESPATPPRAVASLPAVEGKATAVFPPSPPAPVSDKAQAAGRAVPPAESKEGSAASIPVVIQKKSEIKEETLSAPLMTVGPTNVRMAPSAQSNISAVLDKGERVEKTGESGSWTRIKLSTGEEGWVFTDLLKPATSEPSSALPAPVIQPPSQAKPGKAKQGLSGKTEKPAPETVDRPTQEIFMTREIAKMWAEPDSKSKVLLVLKKGRKVEKLGESGEFTKVRLSWGDSGWVLTRFLQPAP